MKRTSIWILLLCAFIFSGCNQTDNNQSKRRTVYKKNFPFIYVQPLGNVNDAYIREVAHGIAKFYGTNVIICKEKALTTDILAKSGTRYEARKILDKYKSQQNQLIITEKDIAVRYNNSDEWGVLGLGFLPGKICVVSTHRLKGNASENLFKERFLKVCIHEIGHNLGLPHCDFNKKCLMNDANGTISQVDREEMDFCDSCKVKLSHFTRSAPSVVRIL